MSAAEAAVVLGITDRQVRNYIHEGVVPAVQCTSGWCIDPENLAKISVVRGKHRNPRPKKSPSLLGGHCTIYYWTKHPRRAEEVARIAAQLSGTAGHSGGHPGHPTMFYNVPSEVRMEELTPGEICWRVANPSVTDPEAWAEIDRAVSRFFQEQGLESLSGNRPLRSGR